MTKNTNASAPTSEKTSPAFETARRMEIVHDLVSRLTPAKTVLMGGSSLAYGSNFSVHAASDIDTAALVDRNRIKAFVRVVNATHYFGKVHNNSLIDAYASGNVDGFRLDGQARGIELTLGVYSPAEFTRFVTLKPKAVLRIYSENSPKPYFESAFDATDIQIDQPFVPLLGGYVRTRSPLANGRFYMGVQKQDALFDILNGQGTFAGALKQKAWKAMIAQFVREYSLMGGDPADLPTHSWNVLHAHHTFIMSPDRLPRSFVKYVQDKTKELLKEHIPS